MFGESKWHDVGLVSGQHVFGALVVALQHFVACCGKKVILAVTCFVCCKASSLKETDFCLIIFFPHTPNTCWTIWSMFSSGKSFWWLYLLLSAMVSLSRQNEEEKKMKNCAKMVLSRSLSWINMFISGKLWNCGLLWVCVITTFLCVTPCWKWSFKDASAEFLHNRTSLFFLSRCIIWKVFNMKCWHSSIPLK